LDRRFDPFLKGIHGSLDRRFDPFLEGMQGSTDRRFGPDFLGECIDPWTADLIHFLTHIGKSWKQNPKIGFVFERHFRKQNPDKNP